MRKQPKQARSIRTREKLMAALETLLKQREFDRITVADIAQTAGVSTGLLYAHFKNKVDFLEALIEIYKQRITERLETVEAQDLDAEYRAAGSLRDALYEITSFSHGQVQEDAHIIRAIFSHFRTRPDTDRSEWDQLRQRASETIKQVVQVYEDDIRRKDLELAAKMLVYFYNTIFIDRFLTGDVARQTSNSINSDVLINEITDFAYGYLTTPG